MLLATFRFWYDQFSKVCHFLICTAFSRLVCLLLKDWISFWVHLLDHERNGQTGKSMKRAPINTPRMKFNPYIYILK